MKAELIAFIGVGNMGNPMAENLIKAGKKVRVYDVSNKMIEKANEKNPDGASIDDEVWSKLPTSLKYRISAKVMGTETEVNF